MRHCMAVCPAGREVIGEYLGDEKTYRAQVSDRLRDKDETVYVVPGSDAEASVTTRFPAKAVKRVGNGLRPNSPRNFLAKEKSLAAVLLAPVEARRPAAPDVGVREVLPVVGHAFDLRHAGRGVWLACEDAWHRHPYYSGVAALVRGAERRLTGSRGRERRWVG